MDMCFEICYSVFVHPFQSVGLIRVGWSGLRCRFAIRSVEWWLVSTPKYFQKSFPYPQFTHAAQGLSTILKIEKVGIFTSLARFVFVSRPLLSFVEGVLNSSVKYIDRVFLPLDSSL